MRELKRLTETPPAAAELRRARDYVIGQIDLGLESTDNQMMWLGEQLIGYGKIISPEKQPNGASAKVKAGEIRAVARDFFRPERLNLALVSPLKTGRGLANLLRHVMRPVIQEIVTPHTPESLVEQLRGEAGRGAVASQRVGTAETGGF